MKTEQTSQNKKSPGIDTILLKQTEFTTKYYGKSPQTTPAKLHKSLQKIELKVSLSCNVEGDENEI